jgi:hypothetical protein
VKACSRNMDFGILANAVVDAFGVSCILVGSIRFVFECGMIYDRLQQPSQTGTISGCFGGAVLMITSF